MENKGLTLADILVTIVISLACGILYMIFDSVYAALKPFGFHVEQLVYGVWLLAGIIAALVIRKPGIALLASIAANMSEMLLGSPYGMGLFIAGFFQGAFAEIIFMIFRYRRYDLVVAIVASLSATVGSLLNSTITSDILSLTTWNLLIYSGARFISAIFVCALPAYGVVRVLELTGVTNLVRPIKDEEFDKLEDN